MSHKRQEIRLAIKDSLIGKTSAGENVFANRARPFFRMPFPAIVIVTGDEENQADDVIDNYLARALDVFIDIYTEATQETDLDEELDAIANEVEACLKDRSAFGPSVALAVLRTTSPEVDVSGETFIGRLRLNYRVNYLASDH